MLTGWGDQLVGLSVILGCSRTGTSLIRFILEAHPDVYCSPDETAGKDLVRFARDGCPRKVAVVPANPYFDTLPLAIPIKCQIITTKRNPVDVVASMATLRNDVEGSLLSTYIATSVERRFYTDGLFRDWMAAELEIVQDVHLQPEVRLAGYGALHYKWIGKLVSRYAEMGYPVHEVGYEALVTNPEPILSSLCDFLGISLVAALIEHHRAEHHSNTFPGTKHLVGGNDPSIPIHSNSIGHGLKVLSAGQIDVIGRLIQAGS